MNVNRVHNKPMVAVTLALLFAFAAAGTVAAAPPGYGGPGGGLYAELPGAGYSTFSGNVFDDVGPLAGATVEIWDGGGLLVSTTTDGNGDWTLSPPGYGGPGGSLYIRLPDAPDSVGGNVSADSLGLQGLAMEWWIDGELATSDTTDSSGDYAMTCPPGYGGPGGSL